MTTLITNPSTRVTCEPTPTFPIWRSADPSDPNIYCFYDDIKKYSRDITYKLPSAEQLSVRMEHVPFGVGVQPHPDGSTRFICQGDAIEWLYQNGGADVVIASLEQEYIEFTVGDRCLEITQLSPLNLFEPTVSLLVEVPESAHRAMLNFLSINQDWDQHELVTFAIEQLMEAA
ncbi:MAG: DUF2811 domain-containing protein [Cyanobacteria bacterium P01_A01_bin.17]